MGVRVQLGFSPIGQQSTPLSLQVHGFIFKGQFMHWRARMGWGFMDLYSRVGLFISNYYSGQPKV